jgi:hypothetical protein
MAGKAGVVLIILTWLGRSHFKSQVGHRIYYYYYFN